MKRKGNFSSWFFTIQKRSTSQEVQESLRDVSPSDIEEWVRDNEIDIEQYTLSKASQLTQQYLKNRQEKKVELRLSKIQNKDQHTEERVKDLIKKYHGKRCFLNGYPAFIIGSKKQNIPIIVSQNPKNQVIFKSWLYIDKFFPHFSGGNLYSKSDGIGTIQKKIVMEQKRKPYPKQNYTLYLLRYRLNTLMHNGQEDRAFMKKMGLDPVKHRWLLSMMIKDKGEVNEEDDY